MEDHRTPFDDAKRKFLRFLELQGWPTDVLWLSRDRLVGRRGTHWVFRPEELTDDTSSRVFYEIARQTASSLRIDALSQIGGRTLAFVQDYGGESRMLNFGDATPPWHVRRISSRAMWACLWLATSLFGSSPFLRSTRLTPRASERGAA